MKTRAFVLPAFLALSLIGARPSVPPLPTSVYSRYGRVPVTRVHPVVCGDVQGAIGCYNSNTRIIQVEDTLDARMATLVLEHEKVHVGLRDANIFFDHKEDEEVLAWAVAYYRLGEYESH